MNVCTILVWYGISHKIIVRYYANAHLSPPEWSIIDLIGFRPIAQYKMLCMAVTNTLAYCYKGTTTFSIMKYCITTFSIMELIVTQHRKHSV